MNMQHIHKQSFSHACVSARVNTFVCVCASVRT